MRLYIYVDIKEKYLKKLSNLIIFVYICTELKIEI